MLRRPLELRRFIASFQTKSLENRHLYEILPKINQNCYAPEKIPVNFELKLCENFRDKTPNEVLETFGVARQYSNSNNIGIADVKFDNLVDGIIGNAEKFDDIQLLCALKYLTMFNNIETLTCRNFHDLWSCFDDICCTKIAGRDLDFLLSLAECWFQLGLSKHVDFTQKLLDHLVRKSKTLTKNQLLHCFFLHNVCRKKSIPFEFEERLEKIIDTFTIEEIGIVALGYFKTESTIKIPKIISEILEKLDKKCLETNQITLAAILKVIRYSKPHEFIPEIERILDKLADEVPQFTPQTCLHIALSCSSMIYYHKKSMDAVAQKLVRLMNNVSEVRLKDMERIINATAMVNYRPECDPDLYVTVFDEIHQERRKEELERFPKIIPRILNFLSIPGMYSQDLTNHVLSEEFLSENYGRGVFGIPRDILHLDCSIGLETENYLGNHLKPSVKYKLSKILIDQWPVWTQRKLTNHDKLFLECVNFTKRIVRDDPFFLVDHVLPHFSRADIIVCRDNTGKFLECSRIFEKCTLGDMKFPPEHFPKHSKFYSLIVIGWNQTIRTTSHPVGLMEAKRRQLEKMGYFPRFITWNTFLPLSDAEKIKYIERLLE